MAPQKPRKPKGFRESQSGFSGQSADFSAIFAAYNNVCAFTGEALAEAALADPRGHLLVLGSDPLTTDPNFIIPTCPDAIFAFERGHLTIGPGFNFLVDLEWIDPEFLQRLNPIGRLRLPVAPFILPSAAALAAHRLAFMEGTLQRS